MTARRTVKASVADAKVHEIWRDKLLLTDSGRPKPCLLNAVIALGQAPQWQGVIGFDDFACRTMLRARPPWAPAGAYAERTWEPADDTRVACWLQEQGILVSPDLASQAIEKVAHDNGFHPVREWLDKLQWDSRPRLDRWAADFLGVEDTPYSRAVAACFLVGGVARIHKPGSKNDHVLILEGPQGIGKSSALRVLGGPFFTDQLPDLLNKDSSLALCGAWIIELSELDSLSRAEVGRIKAFISSPIDRFRPPYGRRVISWPRQCIFAGSVNGTQYLRDSTGGRRFWPIACERVDLDGLAAAREQLWAEAQARYLANETWWLDTPDLASRAADEQRGRLVEDPWLGAVREYVENHAPVVDGERQVTVEAVLSSSMISISLERRGQSEQNRVAHCLVSLGFRRQQRRRSGARVWVYVSPVSPVSKPEW